MRLRRLFCFLLVCVVILSGVFSVSVSAATGELEYNGVLLPDINSVWTDKTTYPFAYIGYHGDDLYLTLNNKRLRYDVNLERSEYTGVTLYLAYTVVNGSWSLSFSSDGSTGMMAIPNNPIWCSVDMLTEDGTVYLPTSDPVDPTPSPPPTAADPVFTQNLPEGSGTVPYTVNYTIGQAAEPLTIVAESPDNGTLSYQWYQYGDVSSVVIENETSPSYTPPTDTAGEVIYYCEVKNTISSGAAAVKNSNHVKVVVSAAPVPTPDPDDPYPGIQDGIDNINNGIGNITDGIDNLGDQITELPGEIGDRVDQATENLGTKILDGIKGLFVPDEEDLVEIKAQWEELLSDRFGAVFESATLIDSVIDAFVYDGDMETISFPSVTVDLAGTPFTFGGWEVEIIPERFRFLTTTSKLITSIVCTVLFLNGMKKRLEELMYG